MKASPRYLIAKYVPDVRRMEPVNIGVVVWANGKAESRFLQPDEAVAFVNDAKTYQRWLTYWQAILAESQIHIPGGKAVPRSDEAFVDEFIKTQKGNYLLADGGLIIDKVSKNKLSAATDYLFDQLVARRGKPSSPREERVKLRSLCSRLFAETGLARRADFKRSYTVSCQIKHARRDFEFDYVVANGQLSAAYHRVHLTQPQSVNHAAFMFEHVQNSIMVEKSRCAAIVWLDSLQSESGMVSDSLGLLREFGTVIDVSEFDEAMAQVAEVAGEAHG